MSIDVMKRALEALALIVAVEWVPAFTRKEYDSDEPEENEMRDRVLTAITALRTAIEQAEKQEPVYYEVRMRIRGNTHNENNGWGWGFWESCSKNAAADYENSQDPQWEYEVRRLYTTPPAAQRQWVGLTKEQRVMYADLYGSYEAVLAVEAKLRELNGGQA